MAPGDVIRSSHRDESSAIPLPVARSSSVFPLQTFSLFEASGHIRRRDLFPLRIIANTIAS